MFTCRTTTKAVGSKRLNAVLRQVDLAMRRVGRRYYDGRRWARMRTRDWLVLLPDWPGDAPELAIDQGERLDVLRVLPAGELGLWLTVDHVNLAALIVAVKRDYPKWVELGLAQVLSPIMYDYSYAELVNRDRRGPGHALKKGAQDGT